MAQFPLGTVSHGTMRTEDLLEAFAWELKSFDPDHQLLLETQDIFDKENFDSEDASYLVNELLPDALQEFCPPFVYFGTLEGDASDFGFWPNHEAIAEAISYGEKDEFDNIILEDENVCINISDHGNIEVYSLDTGKSLWACV
jgi:hypothetical protein